MERGDVAICDNAANYVKCENDLLSKILTKASVDSITLPVCSPRLNPIELVFNVIVQCFASQCNETSISSNEDMLSLLNKVIDSISPDKHFLVGMNTGTIIFTSNKLNKSYS